MNLNNFLKKESLEIQSSKLNHFVYLIYPSKVIINNRPALFFDRDGVIIKDAHYISNPNDVELLPGIKKLLRTSSKLGWLNIVITNQSGIARGLFEWNDYERVTSKILYLLGKPKTITAIYANGNKPSKDLPNDSWRKPNPNMILEAKLKFNINLKDSIIVGDRYSDILSGYRAGIKKYVHVFTGHGKKERNVIMKNFSKQYESDNLICINDLSEFPTNQLLYCY